MTTNVTIVALAQMVDISLNNHEGIINFQALHTLLHVMISQLSLNDVAVEFRGSDSDRIQALISTMKPELKNTVLGEYEVISSKNPERSKKKSAGVTKKISLQDIVKGKQTSEEKKEKEIRVIDRRKNSKDDPDPNPTPLRSPSASIVGVTPEELRTVVVVESRSTLPQYTIALTKQVFDDLQTEVITVRKKLDELLGLPSNQDLIEATRNSTSPIVDMCQLVNLNKRMEAGETAIQKLASVLEDVAKQGGDEIRDKLEEIQSSVQSSTDVRKPSTGILERIVALEKAVKQLSKGVPGSIPPSKTDSITSSHAEEPHSKEEKESHSKEAKEPHSKEAKDQGSVKETKKQSETKEKEETITIWNPKGPFTSSLQNINLPDLDTAEALKLMQEEFAKLNKWVKDSIQEIDKSKLTDVSDATAQVVEGKVNEYARQLQEMSVQYSERIENLKQEIAEIHTKLETILPGGDSTGVNAETTMDLANKLVILEKELLSLAAQTEKLDQDKEERDKQTEAIMEEIDVLKIIKANREDLEEALGEKADACVINRKVSHDQFDAVCDDLTKGIEEALSKLEEQENMWQHTLTTIQRDVGNKLDKDEVDPLKDFVNSKLKALQEKFKALTALKRDKEAAGTKSKLLKNVNCISCDKDVVMKTEMDESFKPQPYAMPPSRNMAPYLTYELDQLRKHQKCVPGGKNLNFYESAMKTQGQQGKNHVCNRYCGGSHTVTTPQQRVTRLGHFLDQWGPEIAPIKDEYIRGKDNHMYKARDDSVYSKTSSRREIQSAKKPSNGDQDLNVSQPNRDALVDDDARQAVMNQEQPRSMSAPSNKTANIGSIPLEPQPDVPSIHGSTQGSLREQRGSQPQEGPRASQMQEAPRASEVTRQSQQQEVPRASQAPPFDERKPSGRTSRVKILDSRGSQSEEQRASQSQGADHRESKASRKGSQQ